MCSSGGAPLKSQHSGGRGTWGQPGLPSKYQDSQRYTGERKLIQKYSEKKTTLGAKLKGCLMGRDHRGSRGPSLQHIPQSTSNVRTVQEREVCDGQDAGGAFGGKQLSQVKLEDRIHTLGLLVPLLSHLPLGLGVAHIYQYVGFWSHLLKWSVYLTTSHNSSTHTLSGSSLSGAWRIEIALIVSIV